MATIQTKIDTMIRDLGMTEIAGRFGCCVGASISANGTTQSRKIEGNMVDAMLEQWPELNTTSAYNKLTKHDPDKYPKPASELDELPDQKSTAEHPGVGTMITEEECITKEYEAPPEVQIATKLIQLHSSAKKRDIEFSLGFDDVRQLLEQEKCYYTNVPMSSQGLTRRTIDRLDSNLGYVPGNVVPCTWQANQLKAHLFESTRSELFMDVRHVLMLIAKMPKPL